MKSCLCKALCRKQLSSKTHRMLSGCQMQLKLFPFQFIEWIDRNAALKNRVKSYCNEAICKPFLRGKKRSMLKKGWAKSNANLSTTTPWKIPRFNHRAKAFHQFFKITSSPCGGKRKRPFQITKQSQNPSSLRILPLPSTFSFLQSIEVNECIWHTFVGVMPRRTELLLFLL